MHACVYFAVGEIIVEEGHYFTLECLCPNIDLTDDVFYWNQDETIWVFTYKAGIHSNNRCSGQARPFWGRVSHFPEALKDGNASIQIQAAKITDSGNYTCYFPSKHSGSSITTEVKVGESLFNLSICLHFYK